MYDVVVIGAGPGGATAARHLAQLGFNTCMIDKDSFPRDKPCGGGFSSSIIDEFPYLKERASEFVRGIGKAGVLHSPNRQIVLEGNVEMTLTLRTIFDNVLFEEAIEAGALPLTGTRAKHLRVNEEYVRVELADGRTIDGKVVIGADGVTSMIARETGLNKSWPSSSITACRVCEVKTKKQDIIDRYTEDLKYHFFANFGGQRGYGWCFPKDTTINVGIGIVGSHAKGLPSKFEEFVRFLRKIDLLPMNANIEGTKGALVPTAGPLEDIVAHRVVLVGDSAGQVSPLTGGGISYAMRAARIAAVVISKLLEKDFINTRSLYRYQRLCELSFGRDFRNQLLAQKILTGSFANVLFNIGSKDTKIQKMVSESMAESGNGEIDLKRLMLRTIMVCLREALSLTPSIDSVRSTIDKS